jgi:hypothetical protein
LRSMIEITITERDSFGSEKLIAKRRLEADSEKQLTQKRARKILAREYAELGSFFPLVRSGSGFVTSRALQPSANGHYHFVWRDYYIAEINA